MLFTTSWGCSLRRHRSRAKLWSVKVSHIRRECCTHTHWGCLSHRIVGSVGLGRCWFVYENLPSDHWYYSNWNGLNSYCASNQTSLITITITEVTYFVFQRNNHNTQTIWVQREFLYKDIVSFCMLMSWLGKTANITRLGILICTNVGY